MYNYRHRTTEATSTMATCKLCLNITVSLFILLCFSKAPTLFVQAQGVRDTIKPGEVLEFADQLTSADGRFILGFFNPLNAAHRYLGIWYKDDPNNVVWVAHPTSPLYGRSGNLTMDADGVLKIMQSEGSTIALNSNHAAENSTATLEDSGNFELTELNPDGSAKQVLWQSFDFPTNTLLPGMKLGVNFQTGQTWFLTSWLSQQIATPGTFTLEWSNSSGSGQLIARRRGDIYWRSGSLNLSSGIFEDIRGSQGKFKFSYVSNQNESYFTYSVLDGSTSRLVLDEKGAISNLLTYGVCYGLSGCVMSEPTCRSRDDPFVAQIGVFDGSAYLSDDNVSIGLSDCWTRCWNECSCIGYNTLNTDGTGCQLWNTDVNFTTYETNGRMPYVLSSAVPPSPSNSSGNEKWWMWLLIAVAGVLVIFSLGFLCYFRRKKLQRDKESREENILLELIANETKESGNAGKKDPDLKVFTFASITAATNEFSTENKLGEGGFGPVYKGKLPEGQEIAVKRLSRSSGQGLVEFKNELLLIAKLQHMNLVRLLGGCVKGEEKMLIYEFMPNKSLDFFLFDPTRRELLDWTRRYKIIDGVAQGLLYLHKYSRLRIIHRDLKVSNILLDDDMNPKISDFGMARIFGRHESEANTNRVVGTYGYMSPEYAMEGNFSEKSDVYSFGVLLLEIVSGSKNSTIYYDLDRPMNLVGFTWQLWREGRIVELIDPTMADSCDRSRVLRCIHVGLLCVQEYAVYRPSMADVISMLSNETVPLPTPKPTAYNTQQKLFEQESCSVSVSSISEMEGR